MDKLVHDNECEQRGRHYWVGCQCAARAEHATRAIVSVIEAWVDEVHAIEAADEKMVS